MKAIALLALHAVLLLAACSPSTPDERSVTVSARNSRFTPSTLTVAAGTTVRFIVRNDDPIAHEFIIGTPAEQAAHEKGTEMTHDGAHGAASLAAGETETVEFTFDEVGPMEFACHLPGHYAYGMRTKITVT